MNSPRILNVGQCGFDHARMARWLTSRHQAEVIDAATADGAIEQLTGGAKVDLVLVNRVGDADGQPGLALVEAMRADARLAAIPVMLVSNYASAQAEAVAAGARPGFGKNEIDTPEGNRRVAEALWLSGSTLR